MGRITMVLDHRPRNRKCGDCGKLFQNIIVDIRVHSDHNEIVHLCLNCYNKDKFGINPKTGRPRADKYEK